MKKRMSKITAMLVCVLMLVSSVPVFAGAAGNVPYCNLTWSYSNGTLTLGGSGAMSSLYEPPWMDNRIYIKKVVIGSDVTSVDAQTLAMSTCAESYVAYLPSSFSVVDGVLFSADKKTLIAYPPNKPDKSYTIPNGVTVIGLEAFHSNLYLENLTFADSVTEICEEAFYGSKKIESLTLNSAVKTIGKHAFSYSALKNIALSAELRTIGDNSFYSCNSLSSIDVPSKVTLIDRQAFQQCTGLQTVSIPASVTEIGFQAFDDNYALTSITVDSGNPNYCSVDGVLYNKAKTTLLEFPASKTTGSFTVPDGVTLIDEEAFEYGKLSAVVLPESVTEIGSSAFSTCISLTSVELPDSLTTLGSYAFGLCRALERLALPTKLSTVGDDAFSGCEKLKTIVIRAAATSLNSDLLNSFDNLSAFEVETGNTHFSAANGVLFNADGTELLKYPKCKAETEYIVPTYVEKISERAFSDTGIESIKLNLKLQEIGDCAFYPCYNLNSITIPVSVTSIGDGAVGFGWYSEWGSNVKENFVITGATGSFAESYATAKGITFNACTHSITEETEVEAACTVGGYTFCVCTDCGSSFKKNETNAVGHFFERDTARDKAATCTATGLEAYTCSRCDETDDKVIDDLGHKEAIDAALAPTCTATGLTQGSHCSVCSEVLVAQTEVAKLSHKEVIDVAVSPTCTATGLTRGSHCSVCSEVLVAQTVVAKLGHIDANSDLKCDRCGTAIISGKKVAGFKATANTSTTVKLTWSALKGATGYQIYKYNGKNYVYYKTVKANAFTDSKLSPNSKLYYKVRPYITVEGKNYYGDLSATVKTYTAPVKATGLKVSSYNTTSLKLTWSKVSGATGYRLYKYNAKSKQYELCKTITSNTNSYTVTKLKAGTKYYFKVCAYKTISGKNYPGDLSSALKTATRPSNTKMSSASSPLRGKLTVKWNSVSGATGYQVQYSTSKTFKSGVVTKYSSKTAFTATGLKSGKTYYVRIRPYVLIGSTKIYSPTVSPLKSVKIK